MVPVQEAINLKEMFGDRYRITLDEAASPESSDPWYFQIPCQFGHICPHSSELLSFFCTGPVMLRRLRREHPELECTLCDGEAIFFFTPDQFDIVAEYAKPKQKRRISEEERQRLAEIGAKTRFTTAVI